jgi:hypothetical protein
MDEPPENRNLPVLAEPAPEARVIERPEPMPLSAPVAAVTGGALAGIGTLFLVRVLRRGLRRQPALSLGGRGRRGRKLDIAASRSFLVDVHVLNKR